MAFEERIGQKEYFRRLLHWNESELYQKEMEIMKMELSITPYDKVLDVGCGTGKMVTWLNDKTDGKVFGYDKYDLLHPQVNKDHFRSEYFFQFTKCYFMHSLAHIDNPITVMHMLKDDMLRPDAEIHILTPNRAWLDLKGHPEGYKPDETVVKHFTEDDLFTFLNDCRLRISIIKQYGDKIGNQQERIYAKAKV